MSDAKWLISVGTGAGQKRLIERAQALGYKVAGLDQAPDAALVDTVITASTYESGPAVEAAQVWANANGVTPAGIIARTSGPANATADSLAAHFGLPRRGAVVTVGSITKFTLAQLLPNFGVHGPVTARLDEPVRPQGMSFPLIVKPDAPLIGKNCVFKVQDAGTLASAAATAAAASVTGLAIAQAALPGAEFGLATMAQDGALLWAGAYREDVSFKDGLVDPASRVAPVNDAISDACLDAATDAASAVLQASGTSGMVFFSFRNDAAGQPNLFEINPGLCGDGLVDALFPSLWPDYDFYAAEIELAAGGTPPPPAQDRRGQQ